MKEIKSYRLCIATNKRYLQEELLRFNINKNGIVDIDLNNKLDGRGCYVYPNKQNLEKLVSKRLLNKCFRTQVDNNVYEQIKDIINEI